LAAALRAGDLEQVKALLPAAGDVNKVYGDTTLFLFALERGQGSAETRLAIVKELLAAGANANVPPGKPLAAVSFQGRAMVELLLEAGADVNYVGADGAPYWWMWLDDETKGEMVPLMLAHGANLQLRVRGFGPVSQAAHRRSWKTMLLLMEAGAPFKGEPSAYVGTLYDDVKQAGAPEAVKALAMMEAGAR
jgi:ankyrin repeat protein